MQSFGSFLSLLIRPEVLFPAAFGTFLGVYIGAIPGLSGTMAVSLLVSLTYAWSEVPAIALIMGVFVGDISIPNGLENASATAPKDQTASRLANAARSGSLRCALPHS